MHQRGGIPGVSKHLLSLRCLPLTGELRCNLCPRLTRINVVDDLPCRYSRPSHSPGNKKADSMIKRSFRSLYGLTLILACVALASFPACSSTDDPADGGVQPPSSDQSNTPVAPETSATKQSAPTPEEQSMASPQIAPTPGERSMASPQNSEGRRGGRLVLRFSDPPTLDPHLTTDNVSGAYVQEVFAGLVTISPDIEIVPDMAEDWEISSDGLRYTFHMHPEAKFHDGTPVTAKDFRWSLERAADPATESPVAEQYLSDIVGVSGKVRGEATSISGLSVVDDSTIAITIDAPKAYFIAKLTYPTAFVLDREDLEANPKDWLFSPNGSGPFRLDQYEQGEVMILGRNDHYHPGPPFVDEVELILSGGDYMLMYENDEIHVTGVALSDLERLQDTSDPLNAQLVTAPSSFSTSYYGMNVNEPPFDDLKFRQAINYAVNKQEIATAVLQDLNLPAKGVIPPRFPSYNPDLRGYDFDPVKAKQLLSESRYSDVDSLPPIVLSIPGSFGATVGPSTEAMLKAWEVNLGIRVDIEHTEWATFLQDLNQRRFQFFAVAWGADYPDPENFLDILFHSESENNHTGYNNPEVDSLLKQARVEPDQTRRFELYNTIEQKIVDEAPWVPLWHSRERKVLIKPEVRDYFLVPMTIPKFRFVYFETN